jgi:PAT family acetyl-CoA transporter-like MFS transporter 1
VHASPLHTRADCLLDLLQGIPVGLAFGSIPFLLRAKLSYSQIGIFTLCTYPYSLKLLWSPIVDSVFSKRLGRRKSWIVPIQIIVGALLWWLGGNVGALMEAVSSFHGRRLTGELTWKVG